MSLRIIAGKLQGFNLKTNDLVGARPTTDRVRGSLMNILSGKLEGRVFIDAFCGSGIIGLEAYSRGADKVYFCDKNRKNILALKANLKQLEDTDSLYPIHGNALEKVAQIIKEESLKSILFLDPPYDSRDAQLLVEQLSCNDIVSRVNMIICEHHHKSIVNADTETYHCFRVKRYGETQLSFLKPVSRQDRGEL